MFIPPRYDARLKTPACRVFTIGSKCASGPAHDRDPIKLQQMQRKISGKQGRTPGEALLALTAG